MLGLVLAHFFQGSEDGQEEADPQVDTHELLNGINAGVIAVDAGGRVEVINRAAIDMLGCKDRPHDLALEQLGVGAELMAMLAGTNAEEVDSELALFTDRFVQARATRLTEGQKERDDEEKGVGQLSSHRLHLFLRYVVWLCESCTYCTKCAQNLRPAVLLYVVWL